MLCMELQEAVRLCAKRNSCKGFKHISMLTLMLQDLVVGKVMEYHFWMDCKCCENKQM